MPVVREIIREEPHYHEDPHYHERPNKNGSNLTWAIVLIVVLALLFTYGIPALRSGLRSTGTQINVPDHFSININQPQQAPQGGGPVMPQPPQNR